MGYPLRLAGGVLILGFIIASTGVLASPLEEEPAEGTRGASWEDFKHWVSGSYEVARDKAGDAWNYLKWLTKYLVNAAKHGLEYVDTHIEDPYQKSREELTKWRSEPTNNLVA